MARFGDVSAIVGHNWLKFNFTHLNIILKIIALPLPFLRIRTSFLVVLLHPGNPVLFSNMSAFHNFQTCHDTYTSVSHFLLLP
jgi:hypothetical protein